MTQIKDNSIKNTLRLLMIMLLIFSYIIFSGFGIYKFGLLIYLIIGIFIVIYINKILKSIERDK